MATFFLDFRIICLNRSARDAASCARASDLLTETKKGPPTFGPATSLRSTANNPSRPEKLSNGGRIRDLRSPPGSKPESEASAWTAVKRMPG